jgi:hypothetical protein
VNRAMRVGFSITLCCSIGNVATVRTVDRTNCFDALVPQL